MRGFGGGGNTQFSGAETLTGKCEAFSNGKRKRSSGSGHPMMRSVGRVRALLACPDAGRRARRDEGDRIFLRKISVVRAGGFLVLEPNFHLGRGKVRWERVLFFFGLTAALAILSSCGSAAQHDRGADDHGFMRPRPDVTVLGTSQCTATVLERKQHSCELVRQRNRQLARSIRPAGCTRHPRRCRQTTS